MTEIRELRIFEMGNETVMANILDRTNDESDFTAKEKKEVKEGRAGFDKDCIKELNLCGASEADIEKAAKKLVKEFEKGLKDGIALLKKGLSAKKEPKGKTTAVKADKKVTQKTKAPAKKGKK